MVVVDTEKQNLINHYLAQRVIETIAALLKLPQGRAQIFNALQKQWPSNRGTPDPIAIDRTLDALDRENTLGIFVLMVPRIEFVRKFSDALGDRAVSFLTMSPEGVPTLLMIDEISADQAFSATIDTIVSEIAAVAVVNDVLVDHEQLCRVTEAIAFTHANKIIRTFVAAQR